MTNLPQQAESRSFPHWRFWFPLAAQLLIVLAIPLPRAITLATGDTVYLSTMPVDPYDLLRGRYVTLRYQIQNPSVLGDLPRRSAKPAFDWEEIFITLAPPEDDLDPTAPWQPVEVNYRYPQEVEPQQVVIRGEQGRRGRWIDLGLGEYYIPEEIGDALEDDIRDHPRETRAEVKVDRWGNAALVSVWVQDREY